MWGRGTDNFVFANVSGPKKSHRFLVMIFFLSEMLYVRGEISENSF